MVSAPASVTTGVRHKRRTKAGYLLRAKPSRVKRAWVSTTSLTNCISCSLMALHFSAVNNLERYARKASPWVNRAIE